MMQRLEDSDDDDVTKFSAGDSVFFDLQAARSKRPWYVRGGVAFIALSLGACLLIFAAVGAASLSSPSDPVLSDKHLRGPQPYSFRSHRLPSTTLPSRYDLFLKVALESQPPWVHGRSRIAIRFEKSPPNDTIVINYSGPTTNWTTANVRLISPSVVAGSSGTQIDAPAENPRAILVDRENGMLGIQFAGLTSFVQASEGVSLGEFVLHFEFDYELERKLAGFYLSVDDSGVPIATTQFEAASARAAFPCFDEPSFKAVFGIQLTVPVAYAAGTLSNGPVRRKQAVPSSGDGDGTQYTEIQFVDTPRMSSYLVAFAVSTYASIEAEVRHGLQIRCWTSADALEELEFALDVGKRALQVYEDLFAIPFPLPKSDMIAIPDFSAGAMENWGLITYRRRALMYDPTGDHSTTSNQRSVSLTVVHELAHQWFGNLVTMKWWDDLYLNEGFATYVESRCLVELGLSTWENFATDELEYGLERDGLPTTRALHLNNAADASVDEIESQFDPIAYSKGGSILRMFSVALGDDLFLEGVRRYLVNFAYANADSGDFFTSLGTAASIDPAHLSQWASQPGFPIVSIEPVEGSTTRFRARQTRWSTTADASSSQDATAATSAWWIPLFVSRACQSAAPTLVTFTGPVSDEFSVPEVPDCPQSFLLANTGRSGYFRVRYTNEMYDQLTDAVRRRGVLPERPGHGFYENNSTVAGQGAVPAGDLAAVLADQLAFGMHLFEEDSLMRFVRLTEALGSVTPSGALHQPVKISLSGLGRLYTLIRADVQLADQFAARVNTVFSPLFSQVVEEFRTGQFVASASADWSDASVNRERPWRLLRSIVLGSAVDYSFSGTSSAPVDMHALLVDCWTGQGPSCAKHIPADAESAVFTGTVRWGTATHFDQVLARYEAKSESKFPAEKARLLYALGANGSPEGAQRALDLALSGRVRQQDLRSIAYSVGSASAESAALAWAWVKDNWTQLSAVDGGAGGFAFRLLYGAVRTMADKQQRDDIVAFFKAHPRDLPEMNQAQVLEVIDENIKAKEFVKPIIKAWLSQ